ncbi:predicted protein [Naegleria gruberi]|uniref:Predicted protein n=1 Tax=Naegleria gruberi TaxID=5762 RepID=D2W472_NAEGR|nr:uncharacterized protein NAEGRDRAFT_54561 [Naegleria gruberi]EFC36123.1 predicted protein [Naegleria gruberi]|eukprot:XP_002668867.1 predicted protein [Naegleria gruberi strain NEG-M]
MIIKCDKLIPACSRCKQKGFKCEYNYETPSLKKKNVRMNPLHNNSANENVRQIKKNTIQTYAEIICIGSPAFSMEQMEEMIFMDTSTLINERKDILAYLLSVQGLCEQRFGFLDFSEKSMQRAREVLKHVYDQNENQYVACTYNHMAFYFAGTMDRKRARFYLSCSENFISELDIYATQRNLSKQEALQERQHSFGSNVVMSVRDFMIFKNVVETLASQSNPLPVSDILENTFYQIVGIEIPEELKKYVDFNLINIYDINTLEERIRGFEAVFNMIHVSLKQSVRPSMCQKMHEFVQLFMLNGVRILKISIANIPIPLSKEHEPWIKLLEQSALALTEASQTDFFSFISPLMIPYYLASANVNLEILKSIVEGKRQNNQPFPRVYRFGIHEIFPEEILTDTVDYFQVVKKDLRALQVLSSRYRYISVYVENTEKLLIQAETQFEHNVEFTSNSESNSFDRTFSYYKQMRQFLLKINDKIDKFLPQEEELLEFLNDNVDPFLCQDMDISEFNSYFL